MHVKKINSIILASELGRVTEYSEIDDDVKYNFLPNEVLKLIHKADEIIFDNDYSIPVNTFKHETYKKILKSSLGPSTDSDRLTSVVSLYEKN